MEDEPAATQRRRALLALLLLVPAPSAGTLAAMVFFPGSATGQWVFTFSKFWLFLFPVVWLKLVDRGRFSLSPIRNGGWVAGLVSGVLLSLGIGMAYVMLGGYFIDGHLFRSKLHEVGLATVPAYAAGALYWILVNSVLEEYVWRWFVYEKCAVLVRPLYAVVLSAVFFSIHHFFALRSYFSLLPAVLCTAGVFAGGVVWSWLYSRYKSIWPGYLSHAVVDLMVFAIGAVLLFGDALSR